MTDGLQRVAAAILDGTPVEWREIDDELVGTDPALLDQLKTLATISQAVHHCAPLGTGDSTWGPLNVFERIGRGAFGDVYRARDLRLDRDVALKFLPSTVAGEDMVYAITNG